MASKASKWSLIACCATYVVFCYLCYKIMVITKSKNYHMKNYHMKNYHLNLSKQPIANRFLDKVQSDFHEPVSIDLIVHKAILDLRARENHDNITVIFITVNRTLLDKHYILGCGVDGKKASRYSMYSGFENYLLHYWLGKTPFKYENMRVHCYDMPAKNGSKVHVTYKTGPGSAEIMELSQHPLYIPAPRVTPTGEYNFTAVTCSKIHNRKASFIREFVQYQRTLGVDHVHFSILDHFIFDRGFEDLIVNDTYLWNEYMIGYLSFSVWKEWYGWSNSTGGEISVHSEILRKLSCMYRYIGTYDYAIPFDTDDFFVPRIPGKTKLKDYILKYCYTKPAGSCRFDWIWYYPECGLEGNITDGNVTAHLKTKVYSADQFKNYKSIHSTKVLYDSSFHDARCTKCLAPGYLMVNVSTHVAYVGHIRYGHEEQAPCHSKGPLI